jgi:protein SCO1/2
MSQNTRLLAICGAFLAGLVLCFSVVLLVLQNNGAGITQAATVGGPFRLVDHDGAPMTDQDLNTPPVMKDYLQSFDPHLRGLTGDASALAAVAKEYRVYYKKIPLDGGGYTMDHTALVYLMDKNGQFVAPFNLKRTPQAAAADLRHYF